MDKKNYYQHGIIYLLIACITILVYWNIYQIPFLYSENVLIAKPYVQDLSFFYDWIYTLNWKAILAKPLTVLTFALNYSFGEYNTAGYHLFNLIIHLLNVFLIYVIAQKFFRWPWFCASLFALHPIATSCVSQLFGRTYSLATFFMLSALYVYFSIYKQIKLKSILLLSLLFLAMILSKQSFVFFPALLIWYVFCISNYTRHDVLAIVRDKRFVWGAVLTAGIIVLFCVFYAQPLSSTAVVTPKTFLLSQFGNLHELLSLYFLPFQTALRHELPFYPNVGSPQVLFGLAVFFIYLALMIRYRHTQVGFLMGAFLIALVPTNSIFPKDEVILEWRLYPSLVFFALLMGNIASQLYTAYGQYVGKFTRVFVCTGAIFYAFYLSQFALSIWQQNQIYQSNILAWKQVIALYPYSANPVNTLGVTYYSLEDYQNAEYYYTKATQMDPFSSLYMMNLAKTYYQQGKTDEGEALFDKALELKAKYGAPLMTVYMKD